jgi:mono/diheme cytochrome c family protein
MNAFSDMFKFSQAAIGALRVFLAVGFLLLNCFSASADNERGRKIYRENCAPCHGATGKGDGVGAQSLPVRPADHTNGKLMASRSDAFLRDVIANGGSAMGLSAFMPAWKGILKDDQIQDLVDYIRTLALPRCQTCLSLLSLLQCAADIGWMAIEKSRNLGSEVTLLQYRVTDESIAGIDYGSKSALAK